MAALLQALYHTRPLRDLLFACPFPEPEPGGGAGQRSRPESKMQSKSRSQIVKTVKTFRKQKSSAGLPTPTHILKDFAFDAAARPALAESKSHSQKVKNSQNSQKTEIKCRPANAALL